MPKQSKLTDLQLILLTTASGRADGSLFPIPDPLKSDDPRLDKGLRGLLTKKLVDEVDVAKPALTWREEDDRPIGLSITDAGREAISVEPEGGASAGADKEPAPTPEKPATGVKAGTKQALLVEMLEREVGASLDEITAATAWLPHSARAMLTGLRKRGYTITNEKVDGVRRYSATKADA